MTRKRRLTIALSATAAVALICMMMHTVVNTLLRTLVSSPMYGTYEIVESWYLPIIGLVGMLAAHLQGEHIQVTALVDRLPWATQRAVRIVRTVAGALLCFFVTIFSLVRGFENTAIGMTAGVTTIPIWPVTLFVPVAFFVLGCFYISDIVADIRGRGPAADLSTPQVDHATDTR